MTVIAILLAALAVITLLSWQQTIRQWGRTLDSWTTTLDELEMLEMENEHLRSELRAAQEG